MKSFQSSSIYPAVFFSLCLLPYGRVVLSEEVEAFNAPGTKVIETGVLREVAGFKGDVVGAEVIGVSTGAEDSRLLNIVIPIDPDAVDQVRVLTPDDKPLKLKQSMEFSFDHENGEVLITLKLRHSTKAGFKFKLVDLPDDQQ